MYQLRSTTLLLAALLILLPAIAISGVHPSYSDKVPQDTVEFYDISSYDQSVPSPNDYLTHPVAKWPNRHGEILTYLKLLAKSSDRVTIETHGWTFEGRELVNVLFSSPENIANLTSLTEQTDKVANPSAVSSASELEGLISDLPAFTWLGYSIHGDEISGTESAVRLAWHLAAANDSATLHLLDNLVIVLDPCENPDGRERYLSMLDIWKSKQPNYDQQAMQHSGRWPWGRANHYWFDLNRDWILHTQPETIGRAATILKYHPVMVVDAHEMGTNASFLFGSPREPINYNTPDNTRKWQKVFDHDQAQAFDKRGWPYYSGEWHEQWYIGYGSAWPTMFGTVAILYEQAGVDGEFVLQRDDYLLTYHQAVNQQFTSSLTNIQTAANNRMDLLRDYHNARKDIVAKGKASNLTYLFAPIDDKVRMKRFIESLTGQGIEVGQASEDFTVGSVTDIFLEKHSARKFPAGTYLVSTAQVHGSLAKAVLEFDPHLKKEFLEEERRELEKFDESKMYEVGTWSVPLAYNLDAYYTTSAISVPFKSVTEVPMPTGKLTYPEAQFGFMIDMEGEQTYRMLGRLFAEEFKIHVSTKSFTVEGYSFKPGALLVRRQGNPSDLPQILSDLATEVGIDVQGLNTGHSTEGSHLGAPTFRLLRQPRIALLAGSPLSFTTAGSLWFTIDQQLELPHSLLAMDRLMGVNLTPYNVLILPDAWGSLGRELGKAGTS
ncbi:MAG: M14 family zinc carboxypeptidase, partial [candidate division Zixibacteria bacterium]